MNHVAQPDKQTLRFLDSVSAPKEGVKVKANGVFMRKIRTYVKRMDMDGDGFFTKRDLELLAERREKIANLSTVQTKQGLNFLTRVFAMFFPSDGKTEIKLTPEQCAESMLSRGRDAILVFCSIWFSSLFQIVDLDGNGEISKEEFRVFHRISNINDPAISDKAFENIDEDKNGTISMMEFVQAGIDYFLSDDENSPYNILFGPLVE